MIIVTHQNEIIAKAKSFNVVNNYFNIKDGRRVAKTDLLNRPVKSEKFNITVVLTEVNEIWQKNQSIVFLKKVEPNK